MFGLFSSVSAHPCCFFFFLPCLKVTRAMAAYHETHVMDVFSLEKQPPLCLSVSGKLLKLRKVGRMRNEDVIRASGVNVKQR